MREMFGHRPGRIFLFILFISTIGLIYVSRYFQKEILIFGWMTLPYLAGLAFVIIWIVAYLIYFFRYWPFRH